MCQGTRTLSLRLSSRAGTILRGVCPPLHDRSQGHPRTVQRFPQCKDGHGRVSSMGKHNPQRPQDMGDRPWGPARCLPGHGDKPLTRGTNTRGDTSHPTAPRGCLSAGPSLGTPHFSEPLGSPHMKIPSGHPPSPVTAPGNPLCATLFLIPPKSSPSSRPVVFPTYQCHPRPHLSMSPHCPRRIHSSARPIPCQPLLTQCSPDPSLSPSPQ